MSFPAGVSGEADAFEQGLEFKQGHIPGTLQLAKNLTAMSGSCKKGSCVTSLQSFQQIYAAVPPQFQPALADFALSDAAFARMRLTAAPMLITVVPTVADLPVSGAAIRGLSQIINSTGLTLPQLVAANRVFVVDFMPYQPYLAASPGGFLEIPTGVFFVDGNGTGGALMPLAIKFNVYNKNTYSPGDTAADWFLAKAIFNSLDTCIHAAVHFMIDHFVLENVCISAERNLAKSHPLYPIITKPCKINAGIIATGLNLSATSCL